MPMAEVRDQRHRHGKIPVALSRPLFRAPNLSASTNREIEAKFGDSVALFLETVQGEGGYIQSAKNMEIRSCDCTSTAPCDPPNEIHAARRTGRS